MKPLVSSNSSLRVDFLPLEIPQTSVSPPLPPAFEIDASPEYKGSVIGQFFDLYLPDGTSVQSFSSSSYMLLIQDHEEPHCTALLALAMAHVGLQNNNLQFMDEARVLYGAALQRLGHELQSSKGDNRDSLMIAINLLSECEELRVTNSGSHAMLTHVQGARDYYLHWYTSGASPCAGILYFTTHLKLLYLSISQRQPLNFAAPSWMSYDMIKYDFFYRLLHELSPLPGILHSFDDVSRCVAKTDHFNHEAANKALEIAFELRSHLTQWYEGLGEEIAGSIYESTDISLMSEYYSMSVPTTFHDAFMFQSYRYASMLTFYWLGVMTLDWNIANTLRKDNIRLTQVGLSNDAETDCRRYARNYAIMICQSIPFLLEQRLCGFLGRISAVRCLRFTQTFFADAGLDAEFSWCSEALGHLHAAGIVVDTERIY